MTRPGRRPAPVPDPAGALGRFAQGLRELRDQAGEPSFEALARAAQRSGAPYSESSLRAAAAGRARPSWEVTAAFVRACALFARDNPQLADEAARAWDEAALLEEWSRRWRGAGAGATGSALPSLPTRFVGRERELAEGLRLLSAERLVTLTGPGGAGKTRLALRLAEEAADRFPGGVWLVELAELDAPATVERAVATDLGVQICAGRGPLESVIEAVADRRMLLVLDNFEHLVEDAAALVRSLLRATPNLRVLATGRQPLDVAGEHVLPVGPLPLPAGDGDVAGSVAVELFVDRAAAASPGFALTERNRAAVAEVCRELDGLPLALELAARRLRVLTVEELRERLDRRFLLGDGDGQRAAHRRHRTLRTVFDWSRELCTPGERRAWERLSVCQGGLSLADAEELGGGGFAAVAGLIDKSLLVRKETGGRTRLRMLETVRMYGREMLAGSGGEAEAHRRHGALYLGLAARAGAAYASPEQAGWLTRLRPEHAHLRQALGRVAHEGTASAAELDGVCGLWLYWVNHGMVGEAAPLLRRVAARLAAPDDPGLRPAWSRMMWSVAYVLLLGGDRDGARRHLDRVEAAACEETAAAVHQLRGLLAFSVGDVAGTTAHSAAALRLDGHPAGLLTAQQATAQAGLAAGMRGARDEAEEHVRRALEMSEACGEVWHRSYVLWVLAGECCEAGRYEEAAALLRDALAIKRRLGDRLGAATVSETLALCLARLGDPGTAALLLGAAHHAWQVAGAPQLWGFSSLERYREQSVELVRGLLGDGPFDAARAEGAKQGLDQLVALVVGPAA
ncbi:ATP-binding protein [Spirillospora sp. NPDC050679]